MSTFSAGAATAPGTIDRSPDALLARLQQRQAAAAAAAAAAAPAHAAAAAADPAASLDARSIDADLMALRDAGGSSVTSRDAARAALQRFCARAGADPSAPVLPSQPADAVDAPAAAVAAPQPNARAKAFMQAVSATTKRALFDTLLTCFLPPSQPSDLTASVDALQLSAGPSASSAVAPLRFRDTVECRRCSVLVVRELVTVLPDLSTFLPRIVSTLAVCMGTFDLSSAPVTLGANTAMHERNNPDVPAAKAKQLQQDEAPSSSIADARALAAEKQRRRSEQEMRVHYLSLLHALLVYCPNGELGVHLPLLLSILFLSLRSDSADEAALLTCDCLVRLAEDYPGPMRAYARVVLVPLMQRLLRHYHSRVRLAAVTALGALVPCGAAELIRDLAAFREHNVIEVASVYEGETRVNYMGLLVADENRRVRLAFSRMVNRWMLSLPDRADYETLIAPYVLSGLSDEDATIQAEARWTLARAGAAFEEEEKERLASGVGGNATDEGAFRMKLAAEEESRPHLSALPPLLFSPFPSRPGWGERQIGRKFLDRLSHAILDEISDWKAGVARKSWRLLRALLVLSEEHITQFTPRLTKAFVGALEKSAAAGLPPDQSMWDCVALVGRYAHTARLVESLSGLVSRAQAAASSERLCAALRVATHALGFVPPRHPAREEALAHLVEAVLGGSGSNNGAGAGAGAGSERDYLAHESSVFESYVSLVGALLRAPGLSMSWRARHAGTLFRVLLEVASWSRRMATGAGGAAAVAEARAVHARLAPTIDAAYLALLAQYDDEETDLLVLFQLHLLPIVSAWASELDAGGASSSSAEPDVASWTDRSLELAMLVEVLSRTSSASSAADSASATAAVADPSAGLSNDDSLFVALPDAAAAAVSSSSIDPAAIAGLNTTQLISFHLQCILLALLERSPHLGVHAQLLPPLARCLRTARASLAPSFSRGLISALLEGLHARADEHAAAVEAHRATAPAAASLRRLPFDEERRIAQAEAAMAARSALFTTYVAGLCACVDAIEARGLMDSAAWRPDDHQSLLDRPLARLAELRPLLQRRRNGSDAGAAASDNGDEARCWRGILFGDAK